jgi:quercetin dioxygenase-like cupin family protein
MRFGRLDEMTKGWFIGDFEPSLLNTKQFEVGIKRYSAGDKEPEHVHKVATEFTVILSGRVCMGGRYLEDGDIIVMEPGESTDFFAVTDCVTVVVKTPSLAGDKYPV